MRVILKGYYVALPILKRQLLSFELLLFLASGILFSFSLSWDSNYPSLKLFGMNIDYSIENDDSKTFNYAYCDLYRTFWILFILPFIYRKILIPLASSFSVNQSLWLRMLNVNYVSVHLSRVYYFLFGAILISASSLIWGCLFIIFYNIDVIEIFKSYLALIGYLFFTSGLVFCLCWKKNINMDTRTALIFTSMSIPFLLFFFVTGSNIPAYLNGYFPASYPYMPQIDEKLDGFKYSIAAGFTGLNLLMFQTARAIFFHFKNK